VGKPLPVLRGAEILAPPDAAAQWFTSESPYPLLDVLRGRPGRWPWRLIACALCRLVYHEHLADARSLLALAAAERFAVGLADGVELADAWGTALDAVAEARWAEDEAARAADAARQAARNASTATVDAKDEAVRLTDRLVSARRAFLTAAEAAARCADESGDPEQVLPPIWPVSPPQYAAILRDVVGNPFQPFSFPPAWRTPTATRLAGGIVLARDFALLPILADALEDAGCSEPGVLGHCRQPGQHVAGCWVLRGLLGG
jgi:hypothetical protein